MLSDNKIYLLGKDVSDSKSKLIQEAIYNSCDIPFSYELCSIESEDELFRFIDARIDNHNFAANVTYPYKKLVNEYLQNKGFSASLQVKYCEGCNLITSEKNLYNFDGAACVYAFNDLDIELKNKFIVICGTGITAFSIQYALVNSGFSNICLLSRTDKRISELSKINPEITFKNYEDAKLVLNQANILIDATPCSFNESPVVDAALLNNDTIVMDVSYGDIDTPLVNSAKSHGLKAFDGKRMLVAQAVMSIRQICDDFNLPIDDKNDFKKMYNIGLEVLNLQR